MQESTSLSDFAAEQGSRVRRCAICALPPDVLAEVNHGLRDGTGHKVIEDWLLQVKQIRTTPTKYHFYANHHLETK